MNDIHYLIRIGLDSDNDDVYDVTIALHGVASLFGHECNRFNDTSGLYPFMAMAASQK